MYIISDILCNNIISSYTRPSMDLAEPWQIGFQDPATPVMEGIISLHHDAMLIIWVVMGLVVWMMGATIYYFANSRHKNPTDVVHGTVLEIVWTVVPALILAVLAVPSFALLYSIEEVPDSTITIKAIGHQWYWTYEYSDYVDAEGESIVFDSYMIPEDDLTGGNLRLAFFEYPQSNPLALPGSVQWSFFVAQFLLIAEPFLKCL